MASVIFKFWLRRFFLIGGIVCIALLFLEIGKNSANPDYSGVILWGLIAGFVAATSGTWWARYKGCGLPPVKNRG